MNFLKLKNLMKFYFFIFLIFEMYIIYEGIFNFKFQILFINIGDSNNKSNLIMIQNSKSSSNIQVSIQNIN